MHDLISNSPLRWLSVTNTRGSLSPSPFDPFLGLDTAMNKQDSNGSITEEDGALVQNSSNKRDPTFPTACLTCRSRHLKCNRRNPCSRCISSNSESDCVYMASQRGIKSDRRHQASSSQKRRGKIVPQAVNNNGVDSISILNLSPKGDRLLSATSYEEANPDSPLLMYEAKCQPSRNDGTTIPITPHRYNSYDDISGRESTGWTQLKLGHSLLDQAASPITSAYSLERCLDSFYFHFFASHPFLLPRDKFLPLVTRRMAEMRPLLAAMRWIGSIFLNVSSAIQDSLLDYAKDLIHDSKSPSNGFLVQAMLLLVVGLDGTDRQENAIEVLSEVEQLALKIKLNTHAFSSLNGQNIPALEESWRRTWWDLYVIDAMMAGTHRATNFFLFDVSADVALPCEEHQYFSGSIPTSRIFLRDIEDNDFSEQRHEISSFAYRVLSGRNLGAFMRMPHALSPEDEGISKIESLLTTWRLNLPPSKQHALQVDGSSDEMMFQAYMIMNATSIILHQPFSELDTTPAESVNSCAPPEKTRTSCSRFNPHTRHVMAAASAITNMITYRVPLLSHTHFFTCIITLSSIVHLSQWARLPVTTFEDENLRQQVRLNMAALSRLSTVWKTAGKASRQVKAVAQQIHRSKKQLQMELRLWGDMMQDNLMDAITEDNPDLDDIEAFRAPSELI